MDKKSSAHSVETVEAVEAVEAVRTVPRFRNYKAARKEQGLKSR
jgi:hypothetical protein